MQFRKFACGISVVVLVVAAPAICSAQFTNLNYLKQLSDGTYQFQANSQTFNAYVDHDGTNGWLLIGRGRENWAWNDAGMGSPAAVSQNLGVTAGFNPQYYSSAIINGLISNSTSIINGSNINLSNVEIRIRRAANSAGTAYSEVRWRPDTQTTWDWNFDTQQYNIDHQFVSGGGVPGGTVGTNVNANTNDTEIGGNDGDRVFTWAWGGHNNIVGFSYGSSVDAVTNNDPTNFLWEFNGENHAIPYTEIYIRSLVEPNAALPEPASIAIWSLVGLALAGFGCYRRWRRG